MNNCCQAEDGILSQSRAGQSGGVCDSTCGEPGELLAFLNSGGTVAESTVWRSEQIKSKIHRAGERWSSVEAACLVADVVDVDKMINSDFCFFLLFIFSTVIMYLFRCVSCCVICYMLCLFVYSKVYFNVAINDLKH